MQMIVRIRDFENDQYDNINWLSDQKSLLRYWEIQLFAPFHHLVLNSQLHMARKEG